MADALAPRIRAPIWPKGKSSGCSISNGNPGLLGTAQNAAFFPCLSGPYQPQRSALASLGPLSRFANTDRGTLRAKGRTVVSARGIMQLGGRTAGLLCDLLQPRRKLKRRYLAVRCSGDGNQTSAGGSLDSAREEGGLSKPALVLPLTSGDVGTASEGKVCIQCKHFKQFVDFKQTRLVADGRMDSCRACEAVTWYLRRGKELGHLALSAEAAWERAKPCRKCHVTKELRDFRRSQKNGTSYYCRACDSTYGVALQRVPTDTPKECPFCKEVKTADQFNVNRRNLSGLSSYCKTCTLRRVQELAYQRSKENIYIRRERKRCPKCGLVKPTSQFHQDAYSTDGFRAYCRPCVRLKPQL